VIFISCKNSSEPVLIDAADLIPKPVSVTSNGESFQLTDSTSIYILGESQEALQAGQYLAEKLRPATGFKLTVSNATETSKPGNIYLQISADSASGNEGYELQCYKR
jgi:hexosaminidase